MLGKQGRLYALRTGRCMYLHIHALSAEFDTYGEIWSCAVVEYLGGRSGYGP